MTQSVESNGTVVQLEIGSSNCCAYSRRVERARARDAVCQNHAGGESSTGKIVGDDREIASLHVRVEAVLPHSAIVKADVARVGQSRNPPGLRDILVNSPSETLRCQDGLGQNGDWSEVSKKK